MMVTRTILERSLGIALACTFIVGCAEDRKRIRPPTADEIPALELISGGQATIGLHLSQVREERIIPSFRITKHPITVRHYRQCISSSACIAPALSALECMPPTQHQRLSGSTFDRPDSDELPVTCVRPEQAATYCRWLGGRLPDSAEWLVAARGMNVRRYSWGNELRECDQHPDARLRGKNCDRTSLDRFRVGTHEPGASPSGVQDVLLTPAELVATSRGAFFSVCGEGTRACLVKGLSPGAIDGFGPISEPRDEAQEQPPSIALYGFRCVLEEK